MSNPREPRHRWIGLFGCAGSLAGLSILCGGFWYSVVFAGLPYQDPPPELAESYAAQNALGDMIMFTGGTITVICALGALVWWFWAKRQGQQ